MPHRISLCLASLLFLASVPARQAEAPLLRTFQAGDVQRYRVELTIRTESDGVRPKRVGRQTFAEPFSDSFEGTISWSVTRRILTVGAEGSAAIEEVLDDFSRVPYQRRTVTSGDFIGQAISAFSIAVDEWLREKPLKLRYYEDQAGQLHSLGEDAGPVLDDAPPVLTLWLRRALRPAAALPVHPPREGARWQEPRAVRLPPWVNVQGTETGEWLAGPMPERSVVKLIQLHTVQQISGQLPASAGQGGEPLPRGEGRFHAESLAALVHVGAPLYGGYGALYSATRSASVELSRVMESLPALNEAPVFRARLTVQVKITPVE